MGSPAAAVEAAWGWSSVWAQAAYEACGWAGFAACVVGFNFDFAVFNFTKHASYFLFNVGMLAVPQVQRQYRQKFGPHAPIPVSASDVAFSSHAVALVTFTLFQVLIYERGSQRVSRVAGAISACAWALLGFALVQAVVFDRWLWAVNTANYLQLFMTAIKYAPQAYMNYARKSTIGWSIGNILLDLTGAVFNFTQLFVLCIDQGSFASFAGNVGKVGLSVETALFDVLFIIQHYVLYSADRKAPRDDVVPRNKRESIYSYSQVEREEDEPHDAEQG
eukprot:jgi/Chlat1/2066/Chrsp17S02538